LLKWLKDEDLESPKHRKKRNVKTTKSKKRDSKVASSNELGWLQRDLDDQSDQERKRRAKRKKMTNVFPIVD